MKWFTGLLLDTIHCEPLNVPAMFTLIKALDKLSTRLEKCAFIEYNNEHKGTDALLVGFTKSFISTHVTFDENAFFYRRTLQGK